MEAKIPDHARIWKVNIADINPNVDQPRKVFTEEAIKELAASVKEKGILQPIVCRRLGEHSFEIIAGERRWRAAQAAGLHEVPVIIKETSNQEALELALIENIQRQDLNPIEEAEAYEHLMREYNLTQQQLADRMGKERATVANLIRLNSLTTEVKRWVMDRELSLGQAKVLLGLIEPKLQKKAAKKIIKDKLSVRQTEKLVQKLKGQDVDSASGLELDQNQGIASKLIRGLEEDLQKTVGSKVSIDYNKGRGKISLNFYSDDELNTFVERLKRGWQK
ncbi:MAG: ParB/RepB/Spo0J family partition protein [Bdellovibrionales bacterium]